MVGGFTECIEKYFETIANLAERGLSVWCLDWRGQGGSERPRRWLSRPPALF
jgi:lysophospholipase